MDKFLTRLAGLLRTKFLATLAVITGGLIALFSTPSTGEKWADVVLKIGTLAALVLVALGYGKIEAAIDKAALKPSDSWQKEPKPPDRPPE